MPGSNQDTYATYKRGEREGVVLLAVAAPAEARAVLTGLNADPAAAAHPWRLHEARAGFDVVVTGIGKSNAAGAVARVLDPSRHRAVISVGVAGVLPGAGKVGGEVGGEGGVGIGSVVVADACIFADEGLETAAGFVDCAAMGFPLGPAPVDGPRIVVGRGLLEELRIPESVVGGIATVSTCSGTDDLAQRIREQTGAVAEAMEGAAVALVGARLGVPAGEVRVISNTTGDRSRQVWELKRALGVLEGVVRELGRRG